MKQLSAKLKSRGATAVVLTLALGAAVYLNWSFSREAPPSLVVSDTSLVSLVSFRDFFRVSSASSRALLRVKRADSKNSVPESLFTLTSWASP